MLVAVGLSHRTAPVEVRERVALSGEALEAALRSAARLGSEALILSTCNRVELYLAAPDDRATAELRAAARDLLAENQRIEAPLLDTHLYLHGGAAAVRHLFRVAASLDSMVVGEPQVLGQVKEAFQLAQRAGTIGPLLGRALPRAFSAAKRVRSETEVARSSASMASAAVDLARHIFGDLQGKEVLVIGAGEMGDNAARHLAAAGAGPLLVTSRTFERAAELAARIGGAAHPWSELPALLERCDVVLSSTGAAQPILSRELVQRVMRARRGRWLCIIDIAVPRDVAPSVGELENVYLYDVDALQELVKDHLAGRQKEAEAAEAIIADEVDRFFATERSLGAVPTIKALREHFVAVARAEAHKVSGAFEGEQNRRALQALADSIVNQLLHAPLIALKHEEQSEALAEAVRTLFALSENDESAASVARGRK